MPKEDESSSQPLNRSDQEAMQALARAIVSEAGLGRSPQQEAAEKRRDEIIDASKRNSDSALDFAKQMTTLNAATIAGVSAVSGASLRNFEPILLYISLSVLALSLLSSGIGYWLATTWVGRATLRRAGWPSDTEEELAKVLERRRQRLRWQTFILLTTWYTGLMFGVAAFVSASSSA